MTICPVPNCGLDDTKSLGPGTPLWSGAQCRAAVCGLRGEYKGEKMVAVCGKVDCLGERPCMNPECPLPRDATDADEPAPPLTALQAVDEVTKILQRVEKTTDRVRVVRTVLSFLDLRL